MIYFTSDWHLGETRLGDITKGEVNVFFRYFKSVHEQDKTIIKMVNQHVKPNDILYHLGDVLMTDDSCKWLDRVKCKNKYLIIGNYDEERIELLGNYFDFIKESDLIMGEDCVTPFNLVHKPCDSNPDMFNIVGHIHGLWKVKRNMVNVGVDAWHFKPVSMKEIMFVKNAVDKGFYDENVFYGEAK